MTAPAKETTSVTVERVVDASPKRLYAAFTSRDELNNWFCNNSFVQAQAGGLYLFIWTQEKYSATGLYKELVADEKLVLTWRSTYEGVESEYPELMTITFDEVDGGTKVTLLHEGMPEEGKELYEVQWNKRLDDLKQYVETGALPNIVNRVIIGIFPGAVDNETAEKLGLEQGTASRVTNLVPNYGAEKAGILVGDIITHMNGQQVGTNSPMNVLVANNKPGDIVDVRLVRDGETILMSMPLSSYPVPTIPESYAALADLIAPQYDQLMEQLTALFEGVSEEEAGKAPAEGEWSAKLVMAHLIYSEQWTQESIGGRITGGQPQHWSGNDNNRLAAMVAASPTIADLLATLRHEYDETLAIWRHFPQETEKANKNHIWNDAFGINGWIQHTQGHMAQITAAIEAAKN